MLLYQQCKEPRTEFLSAFEIKVSTPERPITHTPLNMGKLHVAFNDAASDRMPETEFLRGLAKALPRTDREMRPPPRGRGGEPDPTAVFVCELPTPVMRCAFDLDFLSPTVMTAEHLETVALIAQSVMLRCFARRREPENPVRIPLYSARALFAAEPGYVNDATLRELSALERGVKVAEEAERARRAEQARLAASGASSAVLRGALVLWEAAEAQRVQAAAALEASTRAHYGPLWRARLQESDALDPVLCARLRRRDFLRVVACANARKSTRCAVADGGSSELVLDKNGKPVKCPRCAPLRSGEVLCKTCRKPKRPQAERCAACGAHGLGGLESCGACVALHKHGAHLTWTHVQLDRAQWLDVREAIVVELKLRLGARPSWNSWSDVVDKNVVSGGLRMVGCSKVDDCKLPECVQQQRRAQEERATGRGGKARSRGGGSGGGGAWDDGAGGGGFDAAALSLPCPQCGGSGKLDAGRAYRPLFVLDGDGARCAEAEAAYAADLFCALRDTKIRSALREAPTALQGFERYEGMPLYALGDDFDPRKSAAAQGVVGGGASSARGGSARRGGGSGGAFGGAGRGGQSAQLSSDSAEGLAMQQFIREQLGVVAATAGTSAARASGAASFGVAATHRHFAFVYVTKVTQCKRPPQYFVEVSGAGCTWCGNIGDEHKGNRQYFVFKPSGAYAMCRDTDCAAWNEQWKSRIKPIPAALSRLLFPALAERADAAHGFADPKALGHLGAAATSRSCSVAAKGLSRDCDTASFGVFASQSRGVSQQPLHEQSQTQSRAASASAFALQPPARSAAVVALANAASAAAVGATAPVAAASGASGFFGASASPVDALPQSNAGEPAASLRAALHEPLTKPEASASASASESSFFKLRRRTQADEAHARRVRDIVLRNQSVAARDYDWLSADIHGRSLLTKYYPETTEASLRSQRLLMAMRSNTAFGEYTRERDELAKRRQKANADMMAASLGAKGSRSEECMASMGFVTAADVFGEVLVEDPTAPLVSPLLPATSSASGLQRSAERADAPVDSDTLQAALVEQPSIESDAVRIAAESAAVQRFYGKIVRKEQLLEECRDPRALAQDVLFEAHVGAMLAALAALRRMQPSDWTRAPQAAEADAASAAESAETGRAPQPSPDAAPTPVDADLRAALAQHGLLAALSVPGVVDAPKAADRRGAHRPRVPHDFLRGVDLQT